MNTQQTHDRQRLLSLLGDLPDRSQAIGVTVVAEDDRGTYLLERLVLDLNGLELVPAIFVRPKGQTGRLPAIVYHHSHGYNYALGKDELLRGREYIQSPPYAEALTARGYAALCLDQWGFNERQGRTESEIFKLLLWQGRVMWGMMLFDSLRAVDYLLTREDVDQARIGTLGMSLGSTMAWWLAALDTRVKVCVDICCLTDFQALIDTRNLDGHSFYYYVPGLLKHFTAAEINALIAPRPHLGVAGVYDRLTPPDGLDRIDAHLQDVYRAHGAPDAWRLERHHTGHFETAAMRQQILAFLEQWL
jgi:pimeloyl-ACP methyl ester carboxylesterase